MFIDWETPWVRRCYSVFRRSTVWGHEYIKILEEVISSLPSLSRLRLQYKSLSRKNWVIQHRCSETQPISLLQHTGHFIPPAIPSRIPHRIRGAFIYFFFQLCFFLLVIVLYYFCLWVLAIVMWRQTILKQYFRKNIPFCFSRFHFFKIYVNIWSSLNN